jgi:uncharacterized membrane protein (UPF0136 family)
VAEVGIRCAKAFKDAEGNELHTRELTTANPFQSLSASLPFSLQWISEIENLPIMTNFDRVLWGFIAVLLTGGLIGYFKAGSRVSLLTSCLIAAVLAFAAWVFFGATTSRSVARFIVGCLFCLFGYRWLVSRKFMPGGLMALAALATSGLLAGFDDH